MEDAIQSLALPSVIIALVSALIIAMALMLMGLAWQHRTDIRLLNARRPMALIIIGLTGFAASHAVNLKFYFLGSTGPSSEAYAAYVTWHWFADAFAAALIGGGVVMLALRFRREVDRLRETRQERDKVARSLSNRQDEFTRAIELSNVGIWHWNVADGKVYFSDKLQEMLGADSAPIETIDEWAKRVEVSDAAHQQEIAAAFLEGKHSGEYVTEYMATLPGGEERYFITRAGPWFDDQGNIAGLTGADIDVTEIKQLTKELIAAKEEAETASKMKSTFLANISHELRTPLNAIIGFSEVLDSEMFGPIGDARYKEYASIIRSSGGHLLEIINDLLDVARIEAGEAIVDRSSVDVASVIDQVLDALSTSAARKGVSLNKNIIEPLTPAHADPRHVRQMATNLISNAIKFTERGGSVTVSADSLESDIVAISVTDTGIGIPSDQLERVMQPFQQVAQSYTRDHEGTGLGLPITKSLARLNGGDFLISSTPGTGTEVTLKLPAVSADQVSENAMTQPKPASEGIQVRDAS